MKKYKLIQEQHENDNSELRKRRLRLLAEGGGRLIAENVNSDINLETPCCGDECELLIKFHKS